MSARRLSGAGGSRRPSAPDTAINGNVSNAANGTGNGGAGSGPSGSGSSMLGSCASRLTASPAPLEPAWPLVVHLIALFCFRALSAFFSPVMDCDETFNYVEPLHLLMYGRGLQTWEYSSEYSLRSYLFLWPYAIIGYIAKYVMFPHPLCLNRS